MKEIRTIRMVEQTEVKFVADDGKEFLTEKECKDYERRGGEAKVKAAFERLKVIKLELPLISWYGDNEMWVITLNNERDWITLMDYIDVFKDPYEFQIDEPTEYPCTKVISFESDSIYEYVHNLKAELQAALAQLQ